VIVRAMASLRHPSSDFVGNDPIANERISEIAEILAVGLTRLAARKSSRKPAEFGESSLHFTLEQSGDALPFSAEVSHD
jgi:hypothetical protein